MTTAAIPPALAPIKDQFSELRANQRELDKKAEGSTERSILAQTIEDKKQALVHSISSLKQKDQKSLASTLNLTGADKKLLGSLAGESFVADKELGALARVLGKKPEDLIAKLEGKAADGGATVSAGPMGIEAQLNGLKGHLDAVRGAKGRGKVYQLTETDKGIRQGHAEFQSVLKDFGALADGSKVEEYVGHLKDESKYWGELASSPSTPAAERDTARQNQMTAVDMARQMGEKKAEIGMEAGALLDDPLFSEILAHGFRMPDGETPLPAALSKKQKALLDSLNPPGAQRLDGLLGAVGGADSTLGQFISAAATGDKRSAGMALMQLLGVEKGELPAAPAEVQTDDDGLAVMEDKLAKLVATARNKSDNHKKGIEALTGDKSRGNKSKITRALNARKSMVANLEEKLGKKDLADADKVELERQLEAIQPLVENLEGLKIGNVASDKAKAPERYLEEVMAFSNGLPNKLTPDQQLYVGRLAEACGGIGGLQAKLDEMGPVALADLAGAVRRGCSEADLQELGKTMALDPASLTPPPPAAEPNKPTIDATKEMAKTLNPEFFGTRAEYFKNLAADVADAQANAAAAPDGQAAATAFGAISEGLAQNAVAIGMLDKDLESVKGDLAKAGDKAINKYVATGERDPKLSDKAAMFITQVLVHRQGEEGMLAQMRKELTSMGVRPEGLVAFDSNAADAFAINQTNRADSAAKLGEFDASSLQGRAQALRQIASKLDDKANELEKSQAPGMQKSVQALRTSSHSLREHCAGLDMLAQALPSVGDQLARPGVIDAIQAMAQGGDREKVSGLLNPHAMAWVDEYFKVKGAGEQLLPQLRSQMAGAHVPKELTNLLDPKAIDKAAAAAAKATVNETGPTPGNGPISQDQINQRLQKLNETNPEAFKAITEFRAAQEKYDKVAKSSYDEIMNLLDSGLPIEMIIMMVMLKLTERHEEKFKLKVKEMGVAEQLERINAPIREKLQAQLQRGEINQVQYDKKLNEQVAQPTHFGIHAKSTTILMQELQVEMQYFMQVMNALGAVMRQTQDMVMTPIRNIR